MLVVLFIQIQINYFLVTEIFQGGNTDIVLADYGPPWESLRRVTHTAVRKYANDEKLALLVNDVVGESIETIKKVEGINKPFNPVNYIYLTVFNILASSAFGKRYSANDQEFLKLKNLLENATESFTGIVASSDFVPIIRPFIKNKIKKVKSIFEGLASLLKEKYVLHLKDYEEGQIRDFTDSLISAKLDALQNEKESTPYLTDESLAFSLFDLFSGKFHLILFLLI